MKYIYVLFGILLYLSYVYTSIAPTRLLVNRVGPCDDSAETIISFKELSVTTQTYDASLSGEFNITEDISNGWKIKATMQKCQDIRNIDTCDYFRSFYLINNGCNGDDDFEEEMFTMLLNYANPIIQCPIQAGTYVLTEYPVFTEDSYVTVYESKISTSVFGYTFRLDGFTMDRRKILCVEAYLQLLYIREHDWIGNNKVPGTTTAQPSDDEDSMNKD